LRIEFDRLLRRRKCLEIGFIRGQDREFPQQVVAIGQSDVGVGIIGVARNRLMEGVYSLIQALRRSFVPVEAALEVVVIRFPTGGVMLSGPRRCGQSSHNASKISSGVTKSSQDFGG